MKFFTNGPLLHICMFLLVVEAKPACNIEEPSADIVVVNLTDSVNYHLYDDRNLSNYHLSMTYTWNIIEPEGSKLDGFVCCLTDVDDKQIKEHEYSGNDTNKYFEIDDHLNDNSTSHSDCQTYIGKDFYIHAENGSYITCPYPCEDYLPSCRHKVTNSVCRLMDTEECKVLPKNQRNLTVEIKFGRRYEFTVHLYTGTVFGSIEQPTEKNHIVDKIPLFCADHLIENENLTRDAVYKFCKSEQTISALSSASSPPTDFEWFNMVPNYSTHKVNLVFRWKAPHDVHLNSSVSRYFFSSSGGVSPKSGVVIAKSPAEELVNPYYNISLENVPMGMNVTARVIPAFRKLSGLNCFASLKCSKTGSEAVLFIDIPRFNPCEDNGNESFCHSLAQSTCNNNTENFTLSEQNSEFPNCVCPLGYSGDGRNPYVVPDGIGCQKLKPCRVVEGVEEPCSPEAYCLTGDHASKLNGTCHCRGGFTGDGMVSGSGCMSIKENDVSAIIGGTLAAVVCTVVALLLMRKYKIYKKRSVDRLTSVYVTETGNGTGSLVIPNPHTLLRLFNYTKPMNPVFPKRWELERSAIEQGEIIGRGNFGVVHKATINLNGIEQTVAVKSLTGIYTEHHIVDFLSEINFLVTLGTHENILKLIGVCTASGSTGDLLSPLMVTEYVIYGDLLHFLWDSREVSKREINPIYNFSENSLYNIGRQVAHGLHFLSYKRIIHGDVAARNMLVGEDLTIKISDFGLANDVYRYGMIRCATERRVPFKWISPERMQGGGVPITWRSDVWSFGILLYEMVTLGATPYPGMEPCVIFQKLQSGYRIPQPSSCNDNLYQIILDCWKWKSIERPSFNHLKERLDAAIKLPDSATRNKPIEVQDPVNFAMYERDIGRRDSITISENEPDEHPSIERNQVTNHFSNGNGNCPNGNGNLSNGHAQTENSHFGNTTGDLALNDLCHGDIAVNLEPND